MNKYEVINEWGVKDTVQAEYYEINSLGHLSFFTTEIVGRNKTYNRVASFKSDYWLSVKVKDESED